VKSLLHIAAVIATVLPFPCGALAQERALKPTVNITSHNQSGGITAHTVNIGYIRLSFSDEIATALSDNLPKDKPIEIMAIGSEKDKQVAFQYGQFLEKNGFKIKGYGYSGMQIPPPDDQLSFEVHSDRTVLTIAPRA
jgi:hypothetical protein